ncbi:hypothetical protein Y032_0007g3516 [Ancylostoma ceylanicum]|uniref:Uncharacterized protein n=1 Tax=Ancylostoma ceylanicum TaxID=53326 RepID=A0A016VQB2_9BILA|nr:hypothetical protein Y032_0007g3516 [Ancylostoma ceylanicum]
MGSTFLDVCEIMRFIMLKYKITNVIYPHKRLIAYIKFSTCVKQKPIIWIKNYCTKRTKRIVPIAKTRNHLFCQDSSNVEHGS